MQKEGAAETSAFVSPTKMSLGSSRKDAAAAAPGSCNFGNERYSELIFGRTLISYVNIIFPKYQAKRIMQSAVPSSRVGYVSHEMMMS